MQKWFRACRGTLAIAPLWPISVFPSMALEALEDLAASGYNVAVASMAVMLIFSAEKFKLLFTDPTKVQESRDSHH